MTTMLKKTPFILLGLFLGLPHLTSAQQYLESGRAKVAIVRNPFMASESILAEGLVDSVTAEGATVGLNQTFDLSEEERAYSGWAREALVSRHLADLISVNGRDE